MSSEKTGKTVNMTTGNPVKLILLFAVPMLIGNIFQQIYSAVDTAVAGYNLGDNAIAAIGATSALYSLIIDLASGMNSGCAIVISQSFGANDEEVVKRAVAGTFILNFAITILLTAISVIFLKPLMRFMNTPDTIFGEAYSYMIVICGAMFFTVLYNTFAGILRAVGNSRFPLYSLILASILNIGLDLLFIAVFKMGVAGAVWATIISEAISAFVCGGYLLLKYRRILPDKKHFHVPKKLLCNLCATGLSMGMMYCLVDIGSVVYQRATNAFGDGIISAHTSARRLINIFMQPLGTIASASSTFVGQNWGAGKKDRIKTALKQVLLMEIIWSLFACAIIWFCGGGLIKLTTGTQSDEIISNAILSMRWHLSFFPALGILLVLRTALQAMGKKIAPLISSGIELSLKVVSAFTLIPAIGFLGTCITEPVIWICMMSFLSIFYLFVRKRLYEIK